MFWILKKGMYRGVHKITKVFLTQKEFPVPRLLTGKGCLNGLPEVIKEYGIKRVLIVTDQILISLGLLNTLFQGLDDVGIKYVIYDEVKPNPTIESIEKVKVIYEKNQNDGIIAFGGGSPMDCSKLAAARISNPDKSIRDMKGYFKVKNPIPPLFAVPTTSGTGSEGTVVAVVTDSLTHEKFAIGDLKLVPLVAVLDPKLTLGLPPHITSTTGMDALTHAIEAYIGLNGTEFTDEKAKKATKIIFEHLENVYEDGSNIEGRAQMALASYYAGLAFTRASVGYVHAIAHKLGGLYGVPHGLANAIILPYVLEYYGDVVNDKLAKLAIDAGIGEDGESSKILAATFIEKIKEMNLNMSIPEKIKELKIDDINMIAESALREGNPLYPVPKIMNIDDCKMILKQLVV